MSGSFLLLIWALALRFGPNDTVMGFLTAVPFRSYGSYSQCYYSSVSPNNNDASERDKLLEKAKQLREEAQSLEKQVREGKSKSEDSKTVPAAPAMKPVVSNLKDSTWTVSYRFSSQPKEDNESTVLPNYSGKMTLMFKGDGYTELVSTPTDDKLQIVKVWGWDEEYSQDDQKEYLLFSMDVQFPKTDPKLPGAMERCYFQARIDRSSRNELSLEDGTVTVKKDVAEKTKGMWGLFQVAGILSQFRYVGDFIAKPS